MFLAQCRVMSERKCSQKEELLLKEMKDKLKNNAKYLETRPDKKMEQEKAIATHVLSIYEFIRDGARSFLTTEYKFMTVFVIIMLIVVGGATGDWEGTVISFILGALLSAGCGWIGMSIAVEANVRTAYAAQKGLNEALQVAFSSGAVMGLGVTGSGMIGLCVIYGAWAGLTQNETRYMAGLVLVHLPSLFLLVSEVVFTLK